jgi:hypothetical protein
VLSEHRQLTAQKRRLCKLHVTDNVELTAGLCIVVGMQEQEHSDGEKLVAAG